MLYEMIAVVRPGNIAEVKEIAHKAGSLLLQNGGVIRSLTNWGPFLLTKPVRKHQQKHDSGHHFIMRFDASPEVQAKVRKTIAIDPRMIRCGVVKMVGGDRLVGEQGIKGMSEIGAEGLIWRKGDKGAGSGIFGGR
ncbi:MAG: hypothetical protein LQ338_008010 [Usnochroma carphineum]|nr:MAG: hypothetical protein LQ338_008010 [Usnochroma carphineum]